MRSLPLKKSASWVCLLHPQYLPLGPLAHSCIGRNPHNPHQPGSTPYFQVKSLNRHQHPDLSILNRLIICSSLLLSLFNLCVTCLWAKFLWKASYPFSFQGEAKHLSYFTKKCGFLLQKEKIGWKYQEILVSMDNWGPKLFPKIVPYFKIGSVHWLWWQLKLVQSGWLSLKW